MNLRMTTNLLLASSLLLTLAACGGGGGSSKAKKASALVYTDPTTGTYQLKKNAGLSNDSRLVLDLVAVNGGTGAGVAFQLTADTTKVSWAKVQDGDADYVRNGSVFTLGSAPQALKSKVSGNALHVVVSQKGLGGSVALNGTLATVALSLKTGVTPGSVSLGMVSGKAQALMASGSDNPVAITITPGTLAAE
jgi:hypothetical protein